MGFRARHGTGIDGYLVQLVTTARRRITRWTLLRDRPVGKPSQRYTPTGVNTRPAGRFADYAGAIAAAYR